MVVSSAPSASVARLRPMSQRCAASSGAACAMCAARIAPQPGALRRVAALSLVRRAAQRGTAAHVSALASGLTTFESAKAVPTQLAKFSLPAVSASSSSETWRIATTWRCCCEVSLGFSFAEEAGSSPPPPPASLRGAAAAAPPSASARSR